MSEFFKAPTSTEKVIRRRLEKLELRRIRYNTLWKVIMLTAVVWLLFRFIFGITVVKNDMMYPALHEGDVILYYRLQSNYISSDVVIYSIEGQNYIGRIAAGSEEEVVITEDGQLVINGYVQVLEGGVYTYPIEGKVEYPFLLEKNEYFILSDRREGGIDSRSLGPIKTESLEGKIITVLRRRSI